MFTRQDGRVRARAANEEGGEGGRAEEFEEERITAL